MRRAVQLLDVLAVAALLGAGALSLWPARASGRPTAIGVPSGARAIATGTTTHAADSSSARLSPDAIAAQIVAGNLFSASRRAPLRAFVPPGMDGSTVPMTDGGATASVGDDPAMDASAENGPQLFGIVMQDGARRALLQFPGTDETPRLLAVGERRAGYRVVSIAPQTVVIASSGGTRTLRLVPRTPPDSLENLP